MKQREDGFNTGYRRIGTFFLWTIPLSLGAAACVWLGFFMTAHGWFNELSQEKRRAIYTGAEVSPKAKLKIETPGEGCVKVTKVDLDGSTAAVYFRNDCAGSAKSIKINWVLISPNGTFLASGESYSSLADGPDELPPGGSGEAVLAGWRNGIKPDRRAHRIQFTITNY